MPDYIRKNYTVTDLEINRLQELWEFYHNQGDERSLSGIVRKAIAELHRKDVKGEDNG